MFTKQHILHSIAWENVLLKHLHSKISAEHLDYRPNEHQRTLRELLQYITRGSQTMIKMLENKWYAPEIWKSTREASEAKDMMTGFGDALDEQYTIIADYLENATEETLSEEIDLFGQWAQPAMQYVLDGVLKNYPAYRMQLFMYLKSGLEMYDLNSTNLWIGKDPEKTPDEEENQQQ